MNNKLILIGLGIAIFAGGFIFVVSNSSRQSDESNVLVENAQDVNVPSQRSNDRYVIYSASAFAAAADQKRVYYFHAPWCPTCKVANAEFERNANQIPEDVVLFKTDYDTNGELKKKYAVTYQHTFVQVDSEGNEIAKWNGGGIAELVANVK